MVFSPCSSDLVQEFHRWLSEQREIVKECSDRSGDTQIVERKLQKLKVKLIPESKIPHTPGGTSTKL